MFANSQAFNTRLTFYVLRFTLRLRLTFTSYVLRLYVYVLRLRLYVLRLYVFTSSKSSAHPRIGGVINFFAAGNIILRFRGFIASFEQFFRH